MSDLTLLPRLKWILPPSELLRGVGLFETDVSGQLVPSPKTKVLWPLGDVWEIHFGIKMPESSASTARLCASRLSYKAKAYRCDVIAFPHYGKRKKVIRLTPRCFAKRNQKSVSAKTLCPEQAVTLQECFNYRLTHNVPTQTLLEIKPSPERMHEQQKLWYSN
jgi:hypothetical protein